MRPRLAARRQSWTQHRKHTLVGNLHVVGLDGMLLNDQHQLPLAALRLKTAAAHHEQLWCRGALTHAVEPPIRWWSLDGHASMPLTNSELRV